MLSIDSTAIRSARVRSVKIGKTGRRVLGHDRAVASEDRYVRGVTRLTVREAAIG